MTKKPSPKSSGCEMLAMHLRVEQIEFLREYPFHPKRKWRFDFFVTSNDATKAVAVEIDGGNHMVRQNKYTGRFSAVGRHTKAADYEKLNEAALLGWRVLRFTPAMVKSGYAIDAIKRALI